MRGRAFAEEFLFIVDDDLARRYFDEPTVLHRQGHQLLQDILLVEPAVLDERRRVLFQFAPAPPGGHTSLWTPKGQQKPDVQPDTPGRNDPCCGSGKKYKPCHLSSDGG